MKLKRTLSFSGVKARACGGFTLAEVLAALVFMAIVIPVTVQAVRVASQAGQMGERKTSAARVADRLLTEYAATGLVEGGKMRGTAYEGERSFEWSLETESWSEDAMTLATVRVFYVVQGETYDVTLSTLIDPAQLQGGTTTTESTQ